MNFPRSQWPYFPERWLAEGSMQDGDGATNGSSRARDWTGALNYIRGLIAMNTMIVDL